MSNLLVLAVASAFWPTLIAVDLVALRAPHPPRLLASFLAGGLLTTVCVGVVLVSLLQASSLVSRSRHTLEPGVTLAIGAVALVAGWLLARRGGRQRVPTDGGSKPKPPGWLQRALERGALLAFAAGIVLDLFPGVLPFAALAEIASRDYGLAGTTAVLLGFYLVMFAFIEVPLVAYLIAPQTTAARTVRFNDWLDRNARRLASAALLAAGAYLVLRGVVGLAG